MKNKKTVGFLGIMIASATLVLASCNGGGGSTKPNQSSSDDPSGKYDEDGLEIETEIIDLGDDIFDDDEEPAAKEPEKEPERTGEEPETIELEPSDGDDEEFFL